MKGNTPVLVVLPIETFVAVRANSYEFDVDGMRIWLAFSLCKDFQKDEETVSLWCPFWLVDKNHINEYINTDYEPKIF